MDKLFQIGWVVSWRSMVVALPSMAILTGLAMIVPTLAVPFLLLSLAVGLASLIYIPVIIARSLKGIRAHELLNKS